MRRTGRPTTTLTIAIAILSTGACQQMTAPEVEPDPRPQPEVRRNADVILRRVDIEGGCDGTDILGDAKKGHFQYRVRVQEKAVGTSKTFTKQSRDYGKVLGQVYLRGPGSSIDLDDHTYSITALTSVEGVVVTMYGTEVDTVRLDRYMDNLNETRSHYYPGEDGTTYYEINVGRKGCKMELEYAIRWWTP